MLSKKIVYLLINRIFILFIGISITGCMSSMPLKYKMPLGKAVDKGDIKTVKELLSNGVNACKGQDYGHFPYTIAYGYYDSNFSRELLYRSCKDELYKILIENAYETWSNGNNCGLLLFYAAGGGCDHIVKVLLEKGYDPNEKDFLGKTALAEAAFNGHLSTVKILLEKGADLDLAIKGLRQFKKSDSLFYIKVNNGIEILNKLKPIYDGKAYYKKGDYDRAIRIFNIALEINRNDENALIGRAWAKYQKGIFNEAISDFNKTIENIKSEEKEKLREAIRGKAFSYLGLGDKETAFYLIKQAKLVADYDNNNDLFLMYYVIGEKQKAWKYKTGDSIIGIDIKDYNKENKTGAEVIKVITNSPAEKSGILVGEVIFKLDDKDITGRADFINKTAKIEYGTIIKLMLLREGIEKEILVKVIFDDFFIESDPLIAPIVAKNKTKT